MNDTHIKTLEHVRQFLNGLGAMEFQTEAQTARYAWIQAMLLRFRYSQLRKAEKGLLRDFLQTVSGYSRIQVKRLTQQSRQTGQRHRRQRTVQGFRRRYTLEEIRLLAQTDELHGTLSGPATKKLCERAWLCFGQAEYHRLAGISGPWDDLNPVVFCCAIRGDYDPRNRGNSIGFRCAWTPSNPVPFFPLSFSLV